jgi:hypothetical protein
MQIDRRFADYGLTGGFFLICQLSLLWALGYWPRILDELQALLLPSNNSLLAPILTGFAGALAVIAMFLAGLILDLLASLFRSMEMRVFARHLDLNRDWIAALIESNKAYCGTDYETFQRLYRELPSIRQQVLDSVYEAFTFWKRESRLRYIAAVKVGWGWGVVRQYERLWSFLTSYIVVQSGSGQLNLMADQYSLWRAARAIATALYLFMLEAVLIWFVMIWVSRGTIFPLIGLLFASLGQILISYILLGTYSRLCFTLFSLVYVTYNKQLAMPKDVKPTP